MQSHPRRPGDFRGSIGASRPTAVYSAVSTSMDGIGSSFEPSPNPSSTLGSVTKDGENGVHGGGLTPTDTAVGAAGAADGAGSGVAGNGGLTPSLQKREVVAVKSSNGADNKILESALKNSMEGEKKKKKKKKKKVR